MAEKVFMIALSPTMEEGTILSWKKKVGDQVKMDEALCEVETDKASMEYLSSQEGTLLAIVKDVGTSAKVADMIAVIGEPGEDFSALIASAPATPPVDPQDGLCRQDESHRVRFLDGGDTFGIISATFTSG